MAYPRFNAKELMALLEAAERQGQLSEAETDDILLSDVVVIGRRDGQSTYGVVEVSWGIGVSDVGRAARWAKLLAKTGTPAIPIAAGKWAPSEVFEMAKAEGVWLVTNGHTEAP